MNNRNLIEFDIDEDEIQSIIDELNATDDKIKMAWNRAINRTATTMKARAMRVIRDESGVKKIAYIRKRLMEFKKQKSGDLKSLKFWFGLNDFRVSALKGRAVKGRPGARFKRVKGADVYDKNAFIAKAYGRRSIFSRTTKRSFPIKEMKASIQERTQNKIEDDVFQDLPDVFMRNFISDLRFRMRSQ